MAAIACSWIFFITIILLFPAEPNPSAADMNWAILIIGSVIGGSLVMWVVSARKWFKGPIQFVENNVELSSALPAPGSEKDAMEKSETSVTDFLHE